MSDDENKAKDETEKVVIGSYPPIKKIVAGAFHLFVASLFVVLLSLIDWYVFEPLELYKNRDLLLQHVFLAGVWVPFLSAFFIWRLSKSAVVVSYFFFIIIVLSGVYSEIFFKGNIGVLLLWQIYYLTACFFIFMNFLWRIRFYVKFHLKKIAASSFKLLIGSAFVSFLLLIDWYVFEPLELYKNRGFLLHYIFLSGAWIPVSSALFIWHLSRNAAIVSCFFYVFIVFSNYSSMLHRNAYLNINWPWLVYYLLACFFIFIHSLWRFKCRINWK